MSASSDASATEEPDERVGTLLGGRYRLVERLGQGGMGAVYRAEHVELGSLAAVKVLTPELARNRTAIERFEREARTASRIRHPGVVHVYDLGRASDGSPYLAMELLDGRDLSDELDANGGTIDPERLVAILAPVADALDACHAEGVVHRDLKPSNIFLAARGDGREEPKVVDFGLALLLASDERLTRTGAVAGTPHYLPPEAARGDLAGPSGDVYALATVAYRALCGVTPFDAELASGILVQKVLDDAPTMSARSGVSFPVEVEAALARGLARDPSERPPSASAFVSALRDAVSGVAPGAWPEARRGSTDRALETARATPAAKLAETAEAVTETAPEPAGMPVRAIPPRAQSAPAEGPRTGGRARGRALAVAGALAVLAAVAAGVVAVATGPEPEPTVDEGLQTSLPSTGDRTPDDELGPPGLAEASSARPSADDPPTGPEPADPAPASSPRSGRATSPRARAAAPAIASAADTAARPTAAAPSGGPSAGDPSPSDPSPSDPSPSDTAEAERLVRSAGSLLLRGELEGAIRLLRRATRAAPDHAPAWRSLGLAYERSQRPDEARSAYRRYLELAPGASDADRIRQRVASLGS